MNDASPIRGPHTKRQPYATTTLGLEGVSCCPDHPDARCAYCTVCARHHCLARNDDGTYCLRQTVFRTDSSRSKKHVMISHHRERTGADGWFLSPVRASSRLSTRQSSRASTPTERGHTPQNADQPAFDQSCLVCLHSAQSIRVPLPPQFDAEADRRSQPQTVGKRDSRIVFESPVKDASTNTARAPETEPLNLASAMSTTSIHSDCPTCRCVGPSMCFVHMNSTWAHADPYVPPLTQAACTKGGRSGACTKALCAYEWIRFALTFWVIAAIARESLFDRRPGFYWVLHPLGCIPHATRYMFHAAASSVSEACF